ncbi:MAG: class C sortase [Eubacterium sp.]|nr:class C sortase [Eubacterium sp.]
MKKHLTTIIVVIIFICGLSLFLYPTLSNVYNEHLNNKLIGDYEAATGNISPEVYAEEKEAARLYNENRNNPELLEELGLTYETVLNTGNNGIMGYIEIPKISVSLVIYHTTDEDNLQNGIGHMEESSLPIGGESTHCVLAGHTGLPSAKLLTNIDHLDIGDKFYIHVLDEVLEYQIDDIKVVEPHEVEHLSVVSGKDYVTLVTCTPYGVNSHRLLVRGLRVDENQPIDPDNMIIQNEAETIEAKYLLTVSLIGLAIVVVAVYLLISAKNRRQSKHKE